MFHEYYRFVLCHVFYVKCHAEITCIAQPTRDGGRCAAPHRTHFVALRRCTSTIRAAGRGLLALVGTPSLHTPQRERERKRKKERERERETALPSEHTFFSAHNLHRVVHGNRVRFFGPQSPSGSPRTSCTFSSWIPLGQVQLDWNSAQSNNPSHLW